MNKRSLLIYILSPFAEILAVIIFVLELVKYAFGLRRRVNHRNFDFLVSSRINFRKFEVFHAAALLLFNRHRRLFAL